MENFVNSNREVISKIQAMRKNAPELGDAFIASAVFHLLSHYKGHLPRAIKSLSFANLLSMVKATKVK